MHMTNSLPPPEMLIVACALQNALFFINIVILNGLSGIPSEVTYA